MPKSWLFLLALSVTGSGIAQAPAASATPLTFEVSTVKPSKSQGWRLEPTPVGYSGIGISLRQLVREAYGTWDEKLLVGGPDWVNTDKFDVQAKLADSDISRWKGFSYRQRADTLRALLAERFGLKIHYETKIFPIFNLVIAKGGPKLQLTPPEGRDDLKDFYPCYIVVSGRGHTKRRDCLVSAFAEDLRYDTGRTVFDKTGLTGRYDIELRWTPDNSGATPTDEVDGPSIFTAVQEQLV